MPFSLFSVDLRNREANRKPAGNYFNGTASRNNEVRPKISPVAHLQAPSPLFLKIHHALLKELVMIPTHLASIENKLKNRGKPNWLDSSVKNHTPSTFCVSLLFGLLLFAAAYFAIPYLHAWAEGSPDTAKALSSAATPWPDEKLSIYVAGLTAAAIAFAASLVTIMLGRIAVILGEEAKKLSELTSLQQSPQYQTAYKAYIQYKQLEVLRTALQASVKRKESTKELLIAHIQKILLTPELMITISAFEIKYQNQLNSNVSIATDIAKILSDTNAENTSDDLKKLVDHLDHVKKIIMESLSVKDTEELSNAPSAYSPINHFQKLILSLDS
jgi:hypothetical protein